MKGDYGYETTRYYRRCYDDGDVHVDLPHVRGLLRLSLRCALRIKSKPLCRLNFGGITIAYNRETSPESLGLFFY